MQPAFAGEIRNANIALTPDDLIRSRSTEISGPRDNVIFELGLFMGRLGRDRTFILQPSSSDVKIPTDLCGIIASLYVWPRDDKKYNAAVAPASENIRERIQSLGKRDQPLGGDLFAGQDRTVVQERHGVLSATVNGCEIRAVAGRLEDHSTNDRSAVVLPCNEYFDDECAHDVRSALGAYVNKVFLGQVDEFISCVKGECVKRLGPGIERQMKDDRRALSFGAGRAVLLLNPLGSKVPVGLVSTTTQRVGQGLISKTSFLFDGICELITRLVDERLNEVVMPVLGAGHGRMDPATAFVTLPLALAEAARYAPGGGPLKKGDSSYFQRG